MKNIFTGTYLKKGRTIQRKLAKENQVIKQTFPPYDASDDLVQAVNLALLLQKPLLLMGEPGCGKSSLARVLACELHQDADDYEDFYFEWLIKSSTKAREGLYEYDAIRRLGNAQIPKADREEDLHIKNYINDGPLGEAIQKSKAGAKAILLIDEIDKADLDFPNDLLNELDRAEYTIPELGNKAPIKAEEKPIIIITSNREKDLPDAFLRRCVFHFIKPFDDVRLKNILSNRFYKKKEAVEEEFVSQVVDRFVSIRKELEDKQLIVGKNISTAELIDWFQALKHYSQLDALDKKQDKEEKALLEKMIKELEKLPAKTLKEIPFRQVLFKNHNTLLNFE
ncbi:MAG: ATPase [Saprospiraceae bacterium]|nr:MAG: ATPase [Saprospiraceae bacterium]